MPAAQVPPTGPSTATTPPVMYSQPWSPVPSATAVAPEFRTQNRSPNTPRRNISPPVARDDLVLGDEARLRVRGDDDPATGQALAQVVIGVAGQPQGDPAGQEGP